MGGYPGAFQEMVVLPKADPEATGTGLGDAVSVWADKELKLTVNRTAATHNSADDSQRGNVFLLGVQHFIGPACTQKKNRLKVLK